MAYNTWVGSALPRPVPPPVIAGAWPFQQPAALLPEPAYMRRPGELLSVIYPATPTTDMMTWSSFCAIGASEADQGAELANEILGISQSYYISWFNQFMFYADALVNCANENNADWGGVIEYDVFEPFGAWMTRYILSNREEPPRSVACAELCDLMCGFMSISYDALRAGNELHAKLRAL